MNTYKIIVKYPMVSDTQVKMDTKDLETICNILAHDKCVIIGNKIYTFDNVITIEQL